MQLSAAPESTDAWTPILLRSDPHTGWVLVSMVVSLFCDGGCLCACPVSMVVSQYCDGGCLCTCPVSMVVPASIYGGCLSALFQWHCFNVLSWSLSLHTCPILVVVSHSDLSGFVLLLIKEWVNNCWWDWQNRTALEKCSHLYDDT